MFKILQKTITTGIAPVAYPMCPRWSPGSSAAGRISTSKHGGTHAPPPRSVPPAPSR